MTREEREIYAELIREANKIDKAAGRYLLNEAPLLSDFSPRRLLSSCFTWRYTPQGHTYWQNIHDEINYYNMY